MDPRYEKHIKDKVFNDKTIQNYLMKNNIKACFEYLYQEYEEEDYPTVFIDVIQESGIDYLDYTDELYREMILSMTLGKLFKLDKYTNIKAIHEGAFSYMKLISPIILPDSVEKIKSEAFAYSQFPKRVYISTKSLKQVANDAFYDLADPVVIDGIEYRGLHDIMMCFIDKGIKLV